jgi:hypothetical protein
MYERLRHAAANKLCTWHEHTAGHGSKYITIADSLSIRLADHENTSAFRPSPDFNIVNRHVSEEEFQQIVQRIDYPTLCKKTAFAMHVGLTVPKLKKLLRADCYEDVCENEAYLNTFTQYVRVAPALEALERAGITKRIPVRQERISAEDYAGW